ncbi:hypothetical protein MKW94_004386 [Papaver nudicaule]|uniref:Uncharacterized protein n=1 Tax=Papaver nudicaule TaxID=74823 RepID=A0AA41UVZ2_PAPNU|nr:hypothetical protein [Papaver nudicaule]
MGVDAKPVTKTLDVCVSQPDSENVEKDSKAKLEPQPSEQLVRCGLLMKVFVLFICSP